MKSIPEVSQETLALQEYIMSKQIGTKLSWERIENDTNIPMTERNKQKFRVAMKRAKIEYASIKGFGVKIADPNLVMPILSNKIIKIDRAVKRADKTHKNLQEQFFEQLDNDTQKQVLYAGAIFGAIRVAADNAKRLYGNKKEIANDTISIPVPKY